jgi:peptidoglycan hydrolase-like protein with peptidoglycan-binding domain/anti-sigma regulatory factor (Ser/Thr protein kinase)
MERISSVLARRRPSGVLAAALTLSIAALIGTMLPAVSTASDVSHGPQSSPMLVRGSGYGQPTGSDDVRVLQRQLRHVGFAPGPIDGFFGPLTEGALRRFQTAAGLAPDGALGPLTSKQLARSASARHRTKAGRGPAQDGLGTSGEARVAPLPNAPRPAGLASPGTRTGVAGGPMLMRGSGYGQPTGSDDVRVLQRQLRHVGFAPGPIDGFFGPLTQGALRRLQAAAGLAPDGVLGPATYKALRRARPTAPALALGAGVASRDGVREVGRLQRDLRALGFAPGPLDGRFGRRTEAAVERFQRSVQLAVDGVVGPMTNGELLARSAPTRQRTESEHAATSDGRRETDAARAAQPVELPKDGGPRRDEPDELTDVVANPLVVGVVALMGLAVVVVLTSMFAPRLLPAVARARRRTLAYPTAKIRSALFSSGHLFARKPRGRALGYVSVAQSTLLDSASVLAQLGAIHEGCGAERLSLVEVVHDIDRSQAKPLERPGFQYALDRIAAGDATHLVVAKETALWRSKAEVSEVVRELSRRGGLIYSVNGEPETEAWAEARSESSRQGSPVRRLILDQPASADAAGATRTMIGSMTPDLSGSERYALMLAATEVVNNAVLHAGQRGEGDIRVELAVSEARVRFAVRDDGSGFDVPQSHQRGDPQIGGWGLYLVDAIADRWGVEHEPTTVWLEVARH